MKTKISVTAASEDSNLESYVITKNSKTVIWEDLTKEERLTVMNLLYNGLKFFGQFITETDSYK